MNIEQKLSLLKATLEGMIESYTEGELLSETKSEERIYKSNKKAIKEVLLMLEDEDILRINYYTFNIEDDKQLERE